MFSAWDKASRQSSAYSVLLVVSEWHGIPIFRSSAFDFFKRGLVQLVRVFELTRYAPLFIRKYSSTAVVCYIKLGVWWAISGFRLLIRLFHETINDHSYVQDRFITFVGQRIEEEWPLRYFQQDGVLTHMQPQQEYMRCSVKRRQSTEAEKSPDHQEHLLASFAYATRVSVLK